MKFFILITLTIFIIGCKSDKKEDVKEDSFIITEFYEKPIHYKTVAKL